MKKSLIFLVMVNLIFGIIDVVSATDQGIDVTIGQDIHVVIDPVTVQFGTNILPGTNNNPALNGPISFDATGSNVGVTIQVTAVTSPPFDTGLKLDNVLPTTKIFNLPCVLVSNICTYAPVTTVPTLDVPIGSPAGTKSGTITYTITGPP